MGAMDKKPLFVVSAHPVSAELGEYCFPMSVTVRDDLFEAIEEAEKLVSLYPKHPVLLSRVEMQWGPGIDSKQGE